MGCAFFRFPCYINTTNERKRPKLPKLPAVVDDCQQRILPGIRRCLSAHLLDTCVRDVRLGLTAAQAMIDINDHIKNPDRRGKIAMLNEYRLSGDDPFRRLAMEDFHALVKNLKQVMEELQKRRREIEECLRSTKWWHNASNAVFTVVTIGVIVGSVVLAALVAVPVAVASGTAAGTLVKTVEQCISSIWEQRKGSLEKKQKMVERMQTALQVLSSYDHLESLPSLVRKVKSNYAALAADMDYLRSKFILQDVSGGSDDDDDEATVENKMMDMKTKINDLKAGMDLLIRTADKCTKKIRRVEAELSLINNS